jgi:hypothetical protein
LSLSFNNLMAPATIPKGLALDDRSNALKIPIITLIIFSSTFVLLRLIVSWRNRNYFLLTDHLLWTGHVSKDSTHIWSSVLTRS